MKTYLQQPWVVPAAVLAALALVLGLAQFTLPDGAGASSAPQVGRAPVGRTTAVCPDPSGGRVSVATAPGGDGTGSAVMTTVGGDGGRGNGGEQLATITRRGVVRTTPVKDGARSVVVRAQGSMAASLEVEQATYTGTGAGEGLSATRCSKPATSFWFVGDGVQFGRNTALHLVNADNRLSSVSVDVYGSGGAIRSAAGTGITVEPNSRKTVQLAAIAPKAPVAALHVRTRTGPIVAAVHTEATEGEHALGTDWVPRTTEPRKRLVIPGIPSGGGSRRLLLAAPGNTTATVDVQVVTTEGTYVPKEKGTVQVSPGSVARVDLAGALSKRAAAVRLTSDVPITASVAAASNDGTAYLPAVPALDGGAVITGNDAGAGAASMLSLSAPLKAAAVKVSMFGKDGPIGNSQTVRVPSARTVTVELSPPPRVDGNYAVVVTPVAGSGDVHGARVLRKAAGGKLSMSVLPLRTSRAWVRVPNAEESLSVTTRD